MNEDNEEYKSLLIVNESNDAKVTLYIYCAWLPISITSKILQPNEKYLHREKKAFKYKLVANFEDKREKKEFPGPLELIRDTLIRVTKSLECMEENLAHYSQEKRICLRKIHLANELTSTSGKVNLYDILGLDMTEVRKLSIGDQKIAIKKAFRDQMKIWHPDKNFGDGEIAVQIIVAKETLENDERRACYHNEADYDKGWFSLKRYKAIFWPDCYTEEQNRAYWRRIGFMALSFGLAVGGVVLTALTAGAAAPALVVCGAVFGGGFTGAGMVSGKHTISKNSVVNGFDAKSWALKAGIGFLSGAVTGGASVGITAGVLGIGSAALESGASTFGQYAGTGAGTGAVGGVASSLASDAARTFVDGEKITLEEFVRNAIAGLLIGGATGIVGNLVTKGIVNQQSSAGSAALEGELVEQAALLTELEHFGLPVAKRLAKKLAQNGAGAMLGTAKDFIKERLDDSVENQHPKKHFKKGVENLAGGIAETVGVHGVGTAVAAGIDLAIDDSMNELPEQQKEQVFSGGASEESGGNEEMIETVERSEEISQTNEEEAGGNHGMGLFCVLSEHQEINEENGTNECHRINEGHRINECHRTNECHGIYHENQPFFTSRVPRETNQSHESRKFHETEEDGNVEESYEATFRYNSEGAWISKMIVTYLLNGKQIEKVSCSGRTVKIPSDARQVKVRFQVRRPAWGDIMKYDRVNETWCKPYEPHVFQYNKPPPGRTFTISGNLWWEAVMRVSDEYHEETGEMC